MYKCLLFLIVIPSVYSSDYKTETININGDERSYITKFPQDFDNTVKYPLIIALHGGGSSWKKFNRGTTKLTLEKAANENQILLIFPEGKNKHWNDGRDHLANDLSFNDVDFISGVIDESITKHNADANRIYLTGMSNGGFMAIRLAIELPDKVVAVAAVSAQMSNNIKKLQAKQAISFLLINGTDDPIVPYNGGNMKPFKFSKSRGDLQSTSQTLAYFVKNNNCKTDAVKNKQNTRMFDKTQLSILSYNNCDDATQVRLITVEGGGHTWPGGKQYLPNKLIGRVSREINAGEEIINFFQDKTLNNKTDENTR